MYVGEIAYCLKVVQFSLVTKRKTEKRKKPGNLDELIYLLSIDRYCETPVSRLPVWVFVSVAGVIYAAVAVVERRTHTLTNSEVPSESHHLEGQHW